MERLYCNQAIKYCEEDNWENGCSGNSTESFIDFNISCSSREEAIEFMKNSTGEISTDAFEFNACEEPGRVDVQVQEDEFGNRLTDKQWEEFKQGKIVAYLCTYSFYWTKQVEFSF